MVREISVILLLACFVHAQQSPVMTPPERQPKTITDGWGTIIRGYKSPNPDPVRLSNSTRFENLIRDGKLYLTLQDAIALALENNLDLELERYTPRSPKQKCCARKLVIFCAVFR